MRRVNSCLISYYHVTSLENCLLIESQSKSYMQIVTIFFFTLMIIELYLPLFLIIQIVLIMVFFHTKYEAKWVEH